MPANPEPTGCPECFSTHGHKPWCIPGATQAMEREQKSRVRRQAAKQLEEIRHCDECELCKEHQ